MSFQAASRDLSRDKQFTSMTLIGGYDCSIDQPRKGVDLRVKGGSIIEKSLCVLGNINVAGMLTSEISGNVLTSKIQESSLTQGIQVCGNLVMTNDSFLEGNISVPSQGVLQTPKIQESSVGQGICIASDLTNSGDIRIVNDGDLYLTPSGTVIIGNTAMSIDTSQQVFANLISLQAASSTSLQLSTDTGFKVEVSGGDGLDLMSRSLCNVSNADFTGTISINGVLDMMSANVSNVSQLQTNTIVPTGNTGVTIDGNLFATSAINTTLSVFANNTSAILGGLSVGTLYRTGGDPDLVAIVH